MTIAILYLLATPAAWLGWALAIVAVYHVARLIAKPSGMVRQATQRALLRSALSAGVLLVAAATLPIPITQNARAALRLPVVWPVMPFAVWAAVTCALLAIRSIYKLVLSVDPQERVGRVKSAIGLLVAAAVFAYLHYRSGDTVELLKGAIGLTWTMAISIVLIAIAAVMAMTFTSRSVRRRGVTKGIATQVALLAGSVVFGAPFAWLLITSFKEERDMAATNGMVWIPKVQIEVPYKDPDDPLLVGDFRGTTVQANILEDLGGGQVRLNISRPLSLSGTTFDARRSDFKEIDKMIPVVSGMYKGTQVTGPVVKELDDGTRRVRIDEPASLRGQEFVAAPADLEPVRKVGLRWKNYTDALDYLPPETQYGLVYLKNTLILVIMNVLGTLISSALVAYGFARLRFPGKKALFTLLLSTMMLPAAVTLLPQFLIFRSLGWIDTLYPLWFPAFFASAFNVFLLRQFLMTIPMELEDAAKMDGCSFLRTFWSVMLPQIKPALAVIAIWTIMGAWNNFMGPLIYINSPENMPISYAVQLFQGERRADAGLLMAFATMAMLPVLLLFFFAQRYFIEGVTLSGLGGR